MKHTIQLSPEIARATLAALKPSRKPAITEARHHETLNHRPHDTMKTDPATTLATLATLVPSVAFRTDWEPDNDCRFDEHGMTAPGGCFHGEDPDDWQCWQSDTSARAIVGGQVLTGHAYLGGTWERYGDDPAEVNPDVSGYLPQLLDEAAEALLLSMRDRVPDAGFAPVSLVEEVNKARAYLSTVMRHRYDEQRRHLDTMADTALNA